MIFLLFVVSMKRIRKIFIRRNFPDRVNVNIIDLTFFFQEEVLCRDSSFPDILVFVNLNKLKEEWKVLWLSLFPPSQLRILIQFPDFVSIIHCI